MVQLRFDTKAMTHAGRSLATCCSVVVLSACQSLADLNIDYVCLDPPTPYIEGFDGAPAERMATFLKDRCWRVEAADIHSDDSDLKLEAESNLVSERSWREDPPRLVRRVAGDFVLIAQAETADGGAGDFCKLRDGDAAGIVVRSVGSEPASLAAVTVDPDYESVAADPATDCIDAPATSPPARVHVFADGREFEPTLGVGEDGEAEIAVCRRGGNLWVFYLDREAYLSGTEATPWQEAGSISTIGEDPVDVGLVTTLSATGSANNVQGSFNWLAFDTFVSECGSYLQEFVVPEAF